MSPVRVDLYGKGLDRRGVFLVPGEILLRLWYIYRALGVTRKIHFGISYINLTLARIRQVRMWSY